MNEFTSVYSKQLYSVIKYRIWMTLLLKHCGSSGLTL